MDSPACSLRSWLSMSSSNGPWASRRLADLVFEKFDAYCAEHERTVFDQETVEAWVTARLATSGRYRSWMSYIRDFGRFLRAHGHAEAYVLSDRWKAALVPARPYLLTADEIDAFFTAAARLQAASPWRWQASAFFTLMHSAGLRTCEVRGLLVEHVDLPGRRIDVMWSKGRRSRRLPITSDVADVLAACDDTARSRIGAGRKTFFTSATGNPVTAATVAVMFNRIWDAAGLPRPVSGKIVPGPTIFGTISPTPTSNGGWPTAST